MRASPSRFREICSQPCAERLSSNSVSETSIVVVKAARLLRVELSVGSLTSAVCDAPNRDEEEEEEELSEDEEKEKA